MDNMDSIDFMDVVSIMSIESILSMKGRLFQQGQFPTGDQFAVEFVLSKIDTTAASRCFPGTGVISRWISIVYYLIY